MEPAGAFFDEEYSQPLSRMFFTGNSDFMFQLHHCDQQVNKNVIDNILEESFLFSPNSNCNLEYFSQENSYDSRGSDGMFLLNHEYLQHNDFYMMGHKNSSLNHENSSMKEMDNEMLLKRKFDQIAEEHSGNPKKKSRGPKSKKSGQPKAKKNQKNIQINNKEVGEKERNNNNNNNNAANCESGQSTGCCSSEDDSNASQELNGGTDLKTKTRASRGAATDPQSLYARKRRERINERLRILQSLVPNGTKVDLSTMLEEALHYVKFLQLQIKLLSSDDMWMYAPIAYNGMGIDLSHT